MLKTLLFLLPILLLPSFSSVEFNDIEIYDAMGVDPVIMYPNRVGAYVHRKELGGLVCSMESGVHPRAVAHASCEFLEEINPEVIYENLELVEILLEPQADGTKIAEREVGRLKCQKTIPVHPTHFTEYFCELRQ